ncbi:MAG: DUF481 domain-containing protein [Planctomycetes bacterium]|nr:DUF481 domain-containing protein [Planctomycetota bacterium]
MIALLLAALAPNFVEPTPAPIQTPAPAAVEPKWTGSVSLGVSYSDGNTRRKTGSANADAEYRREQDRTTLGFLWAYSDESGVLTDRKTQLRAKYDYFFSKKMYGLVQASGENDYKSTLDLRTTIGAGLGYQFEDTPTWKLSGELGLSYVNEKYKDSTNDKDFVAARGAYTWDYKPNEKYSLGQIGEIFPSLKNSDDVTARVDTKGRMNLTSTMFAQLEWLYQWNNTPASGAKRQDNLVMLGVGWSF